MIVRELAGPETEVNIDAKQLESTVKDAVRSAIQNVIAEAVEQASSEPE